MKKTSNVEEEFKRVPFEEANELMNQAFEEVKLGFVNEIGQDERGRYKYELVFSDDIDEFWGENFEYSPCCLINNMKPHDPYITEMYVIHSPFKLNLIQNSCCFSFQDCADGICSLAYAYDDLENIFLVLMFGETLTEVESKLAIKNIVIEKKEEQY